MLSFTGPAIGHVLVWSNIDGVERSSHGPIMKESYTNTTDSKK
jgi:hypothetical protein